MQKESADYADYADYADEQKRRTHSGMRSILLNFVMTFACISCAAGSNPPEVTFEYFNLSTNEIWVVNIAGLPPNATPGRLQPNREENALGVKSSTFSETVYIKGTIKIVWKDNGNKGWPGGLNPPGSTPPGVTHEAEFKREDLGIPAKLGSGKVRFTYLGNEKWRVKILK